MATLALLTGNGQSLSLDTDKPQESAQRLQTYVKDQTDAAKAEVQTELDAVKAERDALASATVDQIVQARAQRLGADQIDAESLTAHLQTLNGTQLQFALKEELAAAKPAAATANGTKETKAPAGGSQTSASEKPDDGTALSAGDDQPKRRFLSGSRRATQAAALILAFLASALAPATAATVIDQDAIEVADAIEVPAPTAQPDQSADYPAGYLDRVCADPLTVSPPAECNRAPYASDDQASDDQADAYFGADPIQRALIEREPNPFFSQDSADDVSSGAVFRPDYGDDNPATVGWLAALGAALAAGALGFGTIFGTTKSGVGLRAFLGGCDAIVVTAPAQGLTAGVPVAIGDQYGLPIIDAAEGEDVTCVTKTTDAGFVGVKANVAFSAGGDVFWDADGNPVGGVAGSGAFTNTDDTGANAWMGVALDAAGAGDATVRFQKEKIHNG